MPAPCCKTAGECPSGGAARQLQHAHSPPEHPPCCICPVAGGRGDGLQQRGADGGQHAQRALRLLPPARQVELAQAFCSAPPSSLVGWRHCSDYCLWCGCRCRCLGPDSRPPAAPTPRPRPAGYPTGPRSRTRRARSSLSPRATTSPSCMCTSSGRLTATAPTGALSTSCRRAWGSGDCGGGARVGA